MKADLRTRSGRRREIVNQIETHNGFSIFWVTENNLRATVAQEMQNRGEIVVNKSRGFPWYDVTIQKKGKK